MTERYGERVGCIADRRLRECEELRDHVSDLRLLRTAGPDDRKLDGTRSVFVQDGARLDRCEGRTAGLSELERTVGIAVDEDALDRDRIGRQRLDDTAHLEMDATQTLRDGQLVDLDTASADIDGFRPAAIDDSEASTTRSGIESEHACRSERGGSSCGDPCRTRARDRCRVGTEGTPGSRGVSRHRRVSSQWARV